MIKKQSTFRYLYVYIYPTPLHELDAAQGQFLSNFKQVWI